MTDPIADMLTRIRNAQSVRKETVEVRFSKICFEIGKILERTRFIKKAELKVKRSRRAIELILQYGEGVRGIAGVKRVSKPGQRIYASAMQLRRTARKNGIAVVSTSKGLMTAGEALKQGLGGEILCEAW
ncbi:MAG: 30S ribosomal protein S8 [Candidatus Wildermuthbacteria bacterium RIFCSPHIGHO2_02_FULL_49_9]|uniref:Small ribosomal subunit protein uS8 n=2 Tax=Candidatus Wildermuthiibacteriota TaxID=1817923 RepID=A0A1G2QW77_9BACT|nr:MAG: 30S ribosomal protein S8 [Candidatus Wildermuthbacteria bacterium RIFCSPHIGHO2_01_FULL_49_22b]OHA70077.1 MAG: 30S ribosomal protein S8 [Candidatus Wildermuthbacteria bacterium RIFCSPHIGHO2_02_FULL_49_9]